MPQRRKFGVPSDRDNLPVRNLRVMLDSLRNRTTKENNGPDCRCKRPVPPRDKMNNSSAAAKQSGDPDQRAYKQNLIQSVIEPLQASLPDRHHDEDHETQKQALPSPYPGCAANKNESQHDDGEYKVAR